MTTRLDQLMDEVIPLLQKYGLDSPDLYEALRLFFEDYTPLWKELGR